MSWCTKALSKLKRVNGFPFLQIRLFNDNRQHESGDAILTEKSVPTVSELLQQELVLPMTAKTKTDPSNTTALLFPGQGSHFVGMAGDLLNYPNVKDMFNVASEILRFDLLHYCQHGPQEELDKTVHCQPAVLVTSLAGVEKIQATSPHILENCVAVAGYSVGEFAALVFAGAITFEDAVRLIKVRSEAMQRACGIIEGKMITAVGNAKTRFKMACEETRYHCVEDLAMEDPVCYISSYLSPNCVTIAGHSVAIQHIQDNARKFRINKIFPIPVSGAFHTKLMSVAEVDLKSAVKHLNIEPPLIEVYSNVTGNKYRGVSEIRELLPKQIIRPVKWEQVMHSLLSRPASNNMPNIYEVGPGKQLGTLLKKCNGKGYQMYLHINDL